MKRVKQISGYKTSDGTIFEDIIDAETHQKELNFDTWYEDNKLYGDRDGATVELEELKDWLQTNKTIVNDFINDVDISML